MADEECISIIIAIILVIVTLIIAGPYMYQTYLENLSDDEDEEKDEDEEEEEEFSVSGRKEVILCDDDTILSWSFNGVDDEDEDLIRWTITGPDVDESGSGDDAEVNVTAEDLGEGEHEFTCDAEYLGESDSFTTTVIVDDEEECNNSSSTVPGYDPFLIMGSTIVSSSLIIYFVRKKLIH